MACLHKGDVACSECVPALGFAQPLAPISSCQHCFCLEGHIAQVPHLFCCKCGDRMKKIQPFHFTTSSIPLGDRITLYRAGEGGTANQTSP